MRVILYAIAVSYALDRLMAALRWSSWLDGYAAGLGDARSVRER